MYTMEEIAQHKCVVFYRIFNNGEVRGREVWIENNHWCEAYFDIMLNEFCDDGDVEYWHATELPGYTFGGVEWRQPIEEGV